MNLFNKRKWLALLLSIFVLASAVYLSGCTSKDTDASSTRDSSLVINALGDSITYGSGTDDSSSVYVNQVAEVLGADKVNNYGLPSSPISDTVNPALSEEENENLSFLSRAPEMEKDADIIFVFGGVNDYSLNVPMGDDDDDSAETFSGSLNLLFSGLEHDYPTSKIIALTPLKRYDQTGANDEGYELEDYANQISTIADKYAQVDSIDLYHAEELDFTHGDNKDYLVDGLHPNDDGQTKIADYVTASLASISGIPIIRRNWLKLKFRDLLASAF